MEFWMDKSCTACIKKGKICDMGDIKVSDGQRIKKNEESGYKYLGIIQHWNKNSSNEREEKQNIWGE